MDIVAVDILSGLTVMPEGFKYTLVISDYFTKYSRAFYGLPSQCDGQVERLNRTLLQMRRTTVHDNH